MKNTKLIILGIVMAGAMLTSAQQRNAISTNTPQRRQDIADFAETSSKTVEQTARIAAAADYLKLALVLGLGMLIGRMGAISHRELTELKAVVARVVSHSTATASELKTLNPSRQGETKN